MITGASSGIGRAAAREFARAGARVVLASRNEARLRDLAAEISALPATAALPRGPAAPLVVPADVTRDDDVQALVDRTLDRFGRLDILICNAGVGLYSPVQYLPDDAVRRVFEVNFHGVLRCVQRDTAPRRSPWADWPTH
jgi:NAD(P)-dependent dehydrogenase (short-subunit alcohol dehydrogenase family)